MDDEQAIEMLEYTGLIKCGRKVVVLRDDMAADIAALIERLAEDLQTAEKVCREQGSEISRLQDVMYSACKVSLDLCETCELEPKACKFKTNVTCANKQLREDIKQVKGGAV